MKVLFVTVGTPSAGSSRVRVYNYLPYLNSSGVETRAFLPPFGRTILKSRIWKNLLWPDIIYVQKSFPSALVKRLLSITGRPRIYDLDDALFAVPEYMTPSETERAKFTQSTNEMFRWADYVCVANNYLGDYARKFNPSVFTIPQSIDRSTFVPVEKPRSPNGPPIIGWTGVADRRHFENVKLLVEPITIVAKDTPVILRLMGSRGDKRFAELFRGIDGVTVETVPWLTNTDHIPLEIQKFDVGLAPLIEDSWTLGKNPGKILEYMACGVIPVASAVGMQKEFIQDGVNGFLVETPQQWADKIRQALSGARELTRMKEAALATIDAGYSIEACGKRVLEMLNQVYETSKDELLRNRSRRMI